MIELPPFEELVKLSNEEITSLRQKLVSEFLESVTDEDQRRKLEGLQFKIEMEIRKCKTPMESCLKLSSMMQDSFLELREVLNEFSVPLSNSFEKSKPSTGNVVKFEKKD
jgi:hypothetical protein